MATLSADKSHLHPFAISWHAAVSYSLFRLMAQPDLVLLDIGLPLLNGIEVACQLVKVAPTTGIIFMTKDSSAWCTRASPWAQVATSLRQKPELTFSPQWTRLRGATHLSAAGWIEMPSPAWHSREVGKSSCLVRRPGITLTSNLRTNASLLPSPAPRITCRFRGPRLDSLRRRDSCDVVLFLLTGDEKSAPRDSGVIRRRDPPSSVNRLFSVRGLPPAVGLQPTVFHTFRPTVYPTSDQIR